MVCHQPDSRMKVLEKPDTSYLGKNSNHVANPHPPYHVCLMEASFSSLRSRISRRASEGSGPRQSCPASQPLKPSVSSVLRMFTIFADRDDF